MTARSWRTRRGCCARANWSPSRRKQSTGLADARNPEALAKLTRVKGRRDGKPYSLLVPSLKSAQEVAGGFGRIAGKLARVY